MRRKRICHSNIVRGCILGDPSEYGIINNEQVSPFFLGPRRRARWGVRPPRRRFGPSFFFFFLGLFHPYYSSSFFQLHVEIDVDSHFLVFYKSYRYALILEYCYHLADLIASVVHHSKYLNLRGAIRCPEEFFFSLILSHTCPHASRLLWTHISRCRCQEREIGCTFGASSQRVCRVSPCMAVVTSVARSAVWSRMF